jgi:hypothetical protein
MIGPREPEPYLSTSSRASHLLAMAAFETDHPR